MIRYDNVALALLTLLLAGCVNLAPSYQAPELPVAKQWPSAADAATSIPGGAVALPWESLFADARLRKVVQMALDNNRDLRVAALNIERVRAQYRIQRAARLPQVDASGGQTAQHVAESASRTYEVGVGISAYELDFFGRVRNLQDAALQYYLAADATRRAAHISLLAETADAYLALAANMNLARLARDTLRSRQLSYDMQQERAAMGVASELSLRQAEGELEAARDSALTAQNAIDTQRNALELLVGAPVPPELLPDADALDGLMAVTQLPPGMPADLLQARPDIVAAEHRLRAAHANIGAARAAFFPAITLTASAGRASGALSDLFDGGMRSWSFIPQIRLPIFTAGRLSAELQVSEADRSIALAEYEKAIQSAFRDAADALAVGQVIDGRLQAQSRREHAAQAAHDMVQTRYDNGVASYLEVMDAQRTWYAAQQNRIQTGLERYRNVLTLYKALGGGWSGSEAIGDASPHADRLSPQAPDSAVTG